MTYLACATKMSQVQITEPGLDYYYMTTTTHKNGVTLLTKQIPDYGFFCVINHDAKSTTIDPSYQSLSHLLSH